MADMADTNNKISSGDSKEEENPESRNAANNENSSDSSSNPSNRGQLAPMNRFPYCAKRVKEDFHIADTLYSESSRYRIVKFVERGTFGQVAHCIKLNTMEIVSVKIVLRNYAWLGKKELAVLKQLKKLDTDKYNLVRLVDNFMHRGYVCLALEKLDMSLHTLILERYFKPLSLSEIRVVSQQILGALDALKKIGLAHGFINPDSVMFVNHELEPFKLKLTDFSHAVPVQKMTCDANIQDFGYNAPEIILGLPLNEAIDMWSLGCVMVYAYKNDHLYPTHCPYEMMRVIVQMQGQPDDHALNIGMHTEAYFSKTEDSSCASWRLNSPAEYNLKTGYETERIYGISDTFTSLDDICAAVKNDADYKDTQAFLSLLKSLLQLDPAKRITPSEALRHCFITGGDINDANDETSPVLTTAESKLMVLSGEVISWNGSAFDNFKHPFPMGEETILNEKVDLHVEDILYSESSRFKINRFIGKGGFGKVAHCINLHTRENVAIKIMPKYMSAACFREFSMLKKLRTIDVNKNNLLTFIDLFSHEKYHCLIFEILDKNLFELMSERSFVPLSLSEVRVIAQQMLVALDTLKNIGVAHTDIKPDNIMLVNHKLQPFKVKLIDFGLARPVSDMDCGMIIQPTSYRAPEIILGLPPDAAVDMWSLGCILAFLLLGDHLYPSKCEYVVMKLIVQMIGQPDHCLLSHGLRTREIFTKDGGEMGISCYSPWRMKTPLEYTLTTGSEITKCERISTTFTKLDDIVNTGEELKDFAEFLDEQAFLKLIKSILRVDPQKRITPDNALGHSFITMDHFGSHTQNNYVRLARLTIENCQREQPTVESMVPVPKDDEGTPTDSNNQFNQLDKDMAAGIAGNSDESPAQAVLAEAVAADPDYRVAASVDRSIAGNSDESPAQAGLAEAVAADPDYRVAASADRSIAANSEESPAQAGSAEAAAADFPRISTAATADRSLAVRGDETPAQAGLVEAAAADRTNACNDNERPAQDGLDDTVPADTNNNPNNFVEVKTKKKWFKRLRLASNSKPPVMSGKYKETINNGIDKATPAGPPYMPADTNYRTAGNEEDEDEAAADPSDFVEVKTKQKWYKRIKVAFIRMVRNAKCCC